MVPQVEPCKIMQIKVLSCREKRGMISLSRQIKGRTQGVASTLRPYAGDCGSYTVAMLRQTLLYQPPTLFSIVRLSFHAHSGILGGSLFKSRETVSVHMRCGIFYPAPLFYSRVCHLPKGVLGISVTQTDASKKNFRFCKVFLDFPVDLCYIIFVGL